MSSDFWPAKYVPIHPLRWLPEIRELARRRVQPQMKLLLLSLLVGLVAGLGAVLFFLSCEVVSHYSLGLLAGYFQPPPGGEKPLFAEPPGHIIPWLLFLVPTIGGLFSGLIVYTFAPEAEGHGTDAAIDAYHNRGGAIRARVPIVKIIASAITLGTGGSGGREGPIAQTGAGFGSFLGAVLRLTARERRVLMAAGMGAGIAAIFRAPLAGALFAAEVMYRSPDFESEVVIPAGLSSVIAYCTFGLAFGWGSLFDIPSKMVGALTFNNPQHLIGYSFLVPVMVLFALFYTRTFYGLTHAFRKMKLPKHFRPMIGAGITAVIGIGLFYAMHQDSEVLAVLSFGYGSLQHAMTVDPSQESSLWIALLLVVIAIGKILTTSLTIGSGGSGGVFGPSIVIGGCAGGALGIILHRVWPAVAPHPAAFVIVGMAGFFSAAAKTPFSTLVMVSELTGSYNLLLPTMWVSTLCFLLSDEQSIYSSQLDSPARSPAHQGAYVQAVLMGLSVREFVKSAQSSILRWNDTLDTVIERLAASSYQAIPVTDKNGTFLGIINIDDVHLASRLSELSPLVLATDLMRSGVLPLHIDDNLDKAIESFVNYGLEALPVVDEQNKVIGMVRRNDVARRYLQRLHGPPAAPDLTIPPATGMES